MDLPDKKALEFDKRAYQFLMTKLTDGHTVKEHLDSLKILMDRRAEKNSKDKSWIHRINVDIVVIEHNAIRSFLHESTEGFEFFSKGRFFADHYGALKGSLEELLRPELKLLNDPRDETLLGMSGKGVAKRAKRAEQIREIITIADRIFNIPEKPSVGDTERFINSDKGRGIQP